jgi:hypothetical protein
LIRSYRGLPRCRRQLYDWNKKLTRRQKTIAHDFPFVVKIALPPGGLGKRLNAMNDFYHDRGIQLAVLPHQHDIGGNYLLWCFARSSTAEEFAAEFSAPCSDHHSSVAA